MQTFEGHLSAENLKIAIVAARFNELITKKLVEGAIDSLKRHGINEENLALAWVPGAFEIAPTAKFFAESKNYDAVICIGCVIRGATSHYDYVCQQTASGIMQASLTTGIPLIFSVLTVETIEQAFERAGSKAGNLGFNNALVAIEMAQLNKRLRLEACV